MTKRYVGKIVLNEVNKDTNPTFTYPNDEKLPQKQMWCDYCIWQDNGRQIKAVNQNAVNNLMDIVKELQKLGFTCVKKDGNRKTTSLKYAITAYTDKFNYLKN